MNDCLAHLLETGRVEFTSAGYNWVGGAFYV
jgi:hypothetical protein